MAHLAATAGRQEAVKGTSCVGEWGHDGVWFPCGFHRRVSGVFVYVVACDAELIDVCVVLAGIQMC